MNTPGQDHDAREWEAQEHARRQARPAAVTDDPALGGSGFSRDLFPTVDQPPAGPPEAGDGSYRRVAEALRRPPPVDLPPDFAARVARIAGARTATSAAESSPLLPRPVAFERALTGVLVLAFALCALFAGVVYGARVLAQLQAMVGVQGVQWMALLAGCLGLSWSLDWLRRQAGQDGIARPC